MSWTTTVAPSQSVGAAVGERLARLETRIENLTDVIKGLATKVEELSDIQDQRAVFQRIWNNSFEVGKILLAALAGVFASGLWGKH